MSPSFARRMCAVALVVAGLATLGSASVRADPPVVIDVLGNLASSDYSAFIAPNSYREWGNEPFIAVNPLDPNKIAISSFAFGTSSTGQPGASIWYSTDGGTNWGLRAPVTAPAQGVGVPNDWTFAYDSAGRLHGTVLGGGNVYHGSTSDPNRDNLNGRPAGDWSYTPGTVNHVGAGNADQPYMAISNGHVYIGYDVFSPTSPFPVAIRVARSDDNGATFSATNDLQINAGGSVTTTTNPGTRLATDAAGNGYAIYGIGTGTVGTGNESVTWRLNTYHLGNANWDHTNDTAAPGGILIDNGNSHQIDGTGTTWFGGVNELRGNTTAIAVSKDGSHIYTVYGKQDGSGVDRLFLREFHTDGTGNLVGGPSTVFSVAGQRAALPSVSVTDDGTVYVLYDSYVGDNGNPLTKGGVFQVHLVQSNDNGQTFSNDQVLYSFRAPANPGDPGYSSNRLFGDYQYLTSLGNTVYGTFAARGQVGSNGFNTTANIDPFYFSFTAVPEPSSLALFGLGAAAIVAARRRRRPAA